VLASWKLGPVEGLVVTWQAGFDAAVVGFAKLFGSGEDLGAGTAWRKMKVAWMVFGSSDLVAVLA
jgi:hypothetical protein